MQAIRSPLLSFATAKPIWTYCIHMATRALPQRHPAAVAHALPGILSGIYTPAVTKAALMHRPEVDLDWATAHNDPGLLEFMLQWSKQPQGRPLNYSPCQVVPLALEQPSPDAYDWWMQHKSELVMGDWTDHYWFGEEFTGDRPMACLEWWKARGLLHLRYHSLFTHVSEQGRIDLLDWLWDNVGQEKVATSATFDRPIIGAARKGHVDVVTWWIDKAPALPHKVDVIGVYATALQNNQPAVLEWCVNHPKVFESLQHDVMAARQGDIESMYSSAVRHGLLHWFDVLNMTVDKESLCRVSLEACRRGNTATVQQLYQRGKLIGSPAELVQAAVESGNCDLLDWIHATHQPSEEVDATQLFRSACFVGSVRILDWLIEHGYKVPESLERRKGMLSDATYGGHVLVLDWMLQHGYLDNTDFGKWVDCVISASNKGHIGVLDWLVATIKVPGFNPDYSTLLHDALSQGTVEVIDWWLHKSGPFKAWLHENEARHSVDGQQDVRLEPTDAQHSRAPNLLWLTQDTHMAIAKCINNASVEGDVDILDGLLNRACVPQSTFVQAWTSDAFPDEEQWYWDWWHDEENHGESLVWWRDNVPQVCPMPMNRGRLTNPIHAHFLKHMMGNLSFEVMDPFEACENGNVAMLQYLNQQGVLQLLQDEDHRGVQDCLTVASRLGECHVLEWWKTQSGRKIECPSAITTGDTTRTIPKRAKEWWAQSGLVSAEQLSKMTATSW